MALTVVTSPNPAALDTTKAMGSLNSLTARFTSDKPSIVGDEIQIRLNLFGNIAEPDPTATQQLTSYVTKMPSAGSVQMYPQVNLHETQHIYRVYLDYVDDQTFDISVNFLMLMDFRYFWNGISTLNTFRFEKNVINNPNIDDNGHASVYNTEKQIQMEATDWDGSTAENAVFRKNIHSRFWCSIGGECCDLFAGCIIPNSVDNWTYQIYDSSGLQTTGFSAFDDRTIKFQTEFLAGTTPSKYYIGIYRKDQASNSQNYWLDLEFCMAEYDPTMAAIPSSPFPTTAFSAGGSAMTNLFGDVWEAEVDFDSSYFAAGGTYRVYIVIEDNLGDEYSCVTADIVSNGCPPPTYGDIDLEIYQYDSASTLHTEDFLLNVATRGRIRFDCILDKASYDAAILANGLAGSFDLNFTGYGSLVMDNFPVNTVLQNDGDIPVTFLNNNATDITIRSEFQIPEDWSGSIKYLVFLFSFDITVGALTYTDQLQKVIKLQVRANDELGADVFVPSIVDQDSNPLALDEPLCADSVSEITITFTEVEPDEYDFIQIRRVGTSGEYEENDEYTNTELTQLSDPVIQSADPDTAGGDGDMVIDLANLAINTPISIGGVFINKNLPAPPVCGNINYESILTFVSETEFETRCDVTWDLAPLVDADVAQVSFHFNANGQGWVVGNYFNVADSLSNPMNIYLPAGTPVIVMDVEVYITLNNGCQYSTSYTDNLHLLLPGNSSTVNSVLTPI